MEENINQAPDAGATEPQEGIPERDLFPDLSDAEYEDLRRRVSEEEAEPSSDADPAPEEPKPAEEAGEETDPAEPAAEPTPSAEPAAEPTPSAGPEKEENKPDAPDKEEPSAAPPPAGNADADGMADALKALGYADNGDVKGWEQALADMQGITVEELRKQRNIAPAPATEPKKDDPPAAEEPKKDSTPAAAEMGTAEADELRQIHDAYPQFRSITRLVDLPNFGKIAEARWNGKSLVEAVSSATGAMPSVKPRSSGKEHLVPSGTTPTAAPVGMTRAQLKQAREIFGSGMSDKELADLWHRATK